MKIVAQSVELVALTFPVQLDDVFTPERGYVPDEFAHPQERLIEMAGRVCYKSEPSTYPGSEVAFIERLRKLQHESVIEHASASFRIICDRGISHEIVRHRLASYSQESTRYCNYSKDKFDGEIMVIEPPGLTPDQKMSWTLAVKAAECEYLTMLDLGCLPQIARSVLPTCLKTELVMTANFREWRHFLKLRTAPAAHPQMREVAGMVAKILARISPTVFFEYVTL